MLFEFLKIEIISNDSAICPPQIFIVILLQDCIKPIFKTNSNFYEKAN